MDFIFEYLNNFFIDYSYYHEGIDLTFTAPDQIGGDLSSTDFEVGMYFKVEGTKNNDGAYLIKAISGTAITVDTDYSSIIAESEIRACIYWMDVPKSLKGIILSMLTTDSASTSDNVKSEKQGNRTLEYIDQSSTINAYKSKLSPFKKVKW